MRRGTPARGRWARLDRPRYTVHESPPLLTGSFTIVHQHVHIAAIRWEERRRRSRESVETSGKGSVTLLLEALQTLGVDGDLALAGRWATLQGTRCTVFVAQAGVSGYLTWCGAPCDGAVEFYLTPIQAIEAALRRASGQGMEESAGQDNAMSDALDQRS